MILQALTEYYQVLYRQGKIAAPGWSPVKVTFALCIGDDGGLEQVIDIQTEQARGKKTVPAPQILSLPAPVKRSSGVAANFLCDNSSYILGVDNKGKPQRSRECFEACKALHEQILEYVDAKAAQAVLKFFRSWDPEAAWEHPALAEHLDDILSGGNLIFRTAEGFVHNDPAVRQAWEDYYNAADDGPQGICLVTGELGLVESVHPAIKNVAGAQSSGAALVSFNAPAFCSYGKEQNLNAPTGKFASFAYTAALNHLLADRDHVYRVGDTTVVCWAKGGGDLYQSLFGFAAMGQTDPAYDESELRGMVKQLCQGEKVDYHEQRLDPDMDFYILGLSPNAARLSVRFFLHNTFNGFLACVQKHYDRLKIVQSRYDQREYIPVWRLLYATIRSRSKFEPESYKAVKQQMEKDLAPNLAGEVFRSILTSTRYPATLYNGTLLRIFAEQKIDRVRTAILKAYLLKNYPNKTSIREVMTLPINYDNEGNAFLLGCLFALLEKIQVDAIEGINQTLVDKFLPTAASTPHLIFDSLLEKSRYHLRKLGGRYGHRKDLQELLNVYHQKSPNGFPEDLNHIERGEFMVGYYLKNQELWSSKSNQKKEET